MTAKILKAQLIRDIQVYAECYGMNQPLKSASAYESVCNTMDELHSQLCREQRELCADSYEKELGYKYQILIDSILNAKMPEL